MTLALQMVRTHNVALALLRHADANAVNSAAKLLRAFAQQLEALQRYRGKGQQKVTVEHVQVHSGGQAIVGTVAAAGGRGERG